MGADGDRTVVSAHYIADFFEAFSEVDFEFFSQIFFECFFDNGLILRSVDDYFMLFFGYIWSFELMFFDYDGFGFAEDCCRGAVRDLFPLNDLF